MPQTLSSTIMFTPCGFSPHHLHSPKEDDEGELIFQDGNLTSASLDALIQHLIPTADYYPEKAYIFTFLLSSRLFIEPHELLSRVCHKCIEQQQLDDPVLDKARIRKFGPKILQLLTEWTETFPYDFQEERMIGCLKDIIHRIAPCDEAYWKKMNQLLQTLNQKLASLNRGQEGIVKINAAVSDKVVAFKSKPPSIQREMLSVCSDPYTLAQQLTHVELIFVFQPCFSEQKKTSNLEAYVKWFNRLCYLVATEICMVSKICATIPAKKKQRAQVIEFFIDVARECFNIGNFNSLMAIICKKNRTAKIIVMSFSSQIVIPFFSLLIKDIYFLNEGCANRLPNGHVNFEVSTAHIFIKFIDPFEPMCMTSLFLLYSLQKFLELAKQVGEFITWKQVECPFEQDDNIIHYLHTAPIFTEDGKIALFLSEEPTPIHANIIS
ncbi:hypothetical protein lerEdw1_016201 [Lerista edwardsae]|nr:hypothetical protein lerEdw1_016201 [Lerista edwardsae]